MAAQAARGQRPPHRAAFRIGDAGIEIASDVPELLDDFESRYGDCAVEAAGDEADIRCTATFRPPGAAIRLAFDGPRVPATFDAVLTPFRMLRHLEGDVGRILTFEDDRTLLIDREAAPPDFVTDCVMALVQSVQRGVLFLHAASVGIAGSGVLLIGASSAGKSTTSLGLAARGHAFLGDDVAAIRLASRELLPLPKAARLRDGPFARSLEPRLRTCRHLRVGGPDGTSRTLVRVGDLFPGSVGGPLPLRYAFLFERFAARAAIEPIRPQLADLTRMKSVVSETIPSWGLSPGRDLMKFLSITRLLSALKCYRVELGSTDETSALIENIVGGVCN
ncbi:MAG TPA: hypothetical protein VHP37_11720 [Burkholderiales bacterium]|nr:hypothetical protein [Burkholderiales bacterium]